MLWLCVVCGYSIRFYRQSKLQTLLNIYSFVVTSLSVLLWTAMLFVKLLDSEYNFIDFVALIVYVSAAITSTYYRVKFHFCQQLICDIYGNLMRVDQSLETLRVKLPRTHNSIECSLFIIVYLFLTVLYNYEKFYYSYYESESYVDCRMMYNHLSTVTLSVSVMTLHILF